MTKNYCGLCGKEVLHTEPSIRYVGPRVVRVWAKDNFKNKFVSKDRVELRDTILCMPCAEDLAGNFPVIEN